MDRLVSRALAAPVLCAVPCAPAALAQRPVRPDVPVREAVVNAPVAPDAIYVGRAGAGLSVVDLNGFGASTGNPAFDLFYGLDSEGTSHYPFNPNLSLQGSSIVPPLAPGTTSVDGGSAGVFTLTRDSLLSDTLFELPAVADMMLGQPLDKQYNAGVTACAAGANLCATTSLQVVSLGFSPPHSLVPMTAGAIQTTVGEGNPISWAPHPNPPPLLPVPLCGAPRIDGQEPTSAVTPTLGLSNLLVPGNPFGNPSAGVPPSGLLSLEQNAFFNGPAPPQLTIGECLPFAVRQQVGHYLYAVDPASDAVLVLNSNRMTVLDVLPVEGPTELAMSPDLRFLAVSRRAAASVAFIDVDPRSRTFHSVVQESPVGAGPVGIAWEPGNEDVLVCCEDENAVYVLSAFTLSVRKVVSGIRRPFAVAITPRQDRFGFQRNVYFAYVLGRNGVVSLFESGPSGTNGWGFDDVVATAPFRFWGATAIQPDHARLESGVWIAHRRLAPDGAATGTPEGVVSNLVLEAETAGTILLEPGEEPNPRGLSFRIERALGSLSGIPLDLAFDDQRNLGALRDYVTAFSAGAPAPINGKNLVRDVAGVGVLSTNEPTYLFVPTRDGAGASFVDVLDLRTGERVDTNAFLAGVQSIPAPGAHLVMDYFRQ